MKCNDDTGALLANTESVCEVDRLVATEFAREYPSIVASSVFHAVFKVVVQIAARELARKAAEEEYDHNHLGKDDYSETARKWAGNVAAMSVSFAGSKIAEAATYADIRTWCSLPKEYQGAIFKRPESGKISFVNPDSGAEVAALDLQGKGPFFVYIKQVLPSSAPLVLCTSPSIAAATAAAIEQANNDQQEITE